MFISLCLCLKLLKCKAIKEYHKNAILIFLGNFKSLFLSIIHQSFKTKIDNSYLNRLDKQSCQQTRSNFSPSPPNPMEVIPLVQKPGHIIDIWYFFTVSLKVPFLLTLAH